MKRFMIPAGTGVYPTRLDIQYGKPLKFSFRCQNYPETTKVDWHFSSVDWFVGSTTNDELTLADKICNVLGLHHPMLIKLRGMNNTLTNAFIVEEKDVVELFE